MTSKPSFREERKLWKKGYSCVVGVDEVGRGAFAGPVVVGAVVFNKDTPYQQRTRSILAEINDSKLIRPRKRQQLAEIIKENAAFSGTASIGVGVINRQGIGKATAMAMRRAIAQARTELKNQRLFVLVDGFHIKYLQGIGLKNQKAIIKGDRKSISIAAASIIAKVYRDKLMKTLSKKYPQYRLGKNKGYGTKQHQQALKKYGLSKIHRKSFNLSKYLA